jgi:hypothetical protein
LAVLPLFLGKISPHYAWFLAPDTRHPFHLNVIFILTQALIHWAYCPTHARLTLYKNMLFILSAFWHQIPCMLGPLLYQLGFWLPVLVSVSPLYVSFYSLLRLYYPTAVCPLRGCPWMTPCYPLRLWQAHSVHC